MDDLFRKIYHVKYVDDFSVRFIELCKEGMEI
jgi:hypothetical protein